MSRYIARLAKRTGIAGKADKNRTSVSSGRATESPAKKTATSLTSSKKQAIEVTEKITAAPVTAKKYTRMSTNNVKKTINSGLIPETLESNPNTSKNRKKAEYRLGDDARNTRLLERRTSRFGTDQPQSTSKPAINSGVESPGEISPQQIFSKSHRIELSEKADENKLGSQYILDGPELNTKNEIPANSEAIDVPQTDRETIGNNISLSEKLMPVPPASEIFQMDAVDEHSSLQALTIGEVSPDLSQQDIAENLAVVSETGVQHKAEPVLNRRLAEVRQVEVPAQLVNNEIPNRSNTASIGISIGKIDISVQHARESKPPQPNVSAATKPTSQPTLPTNLSRYYLRNR